MSYSAVPPMIRSASGFAQGVNENDLTSPESPFLPEWGVSKLNETLNQAIALWWLDKRHAPNYFKPMNFAGAQIEQMNYQRVRIDPQIGGAAGSKPNWL